MHAGMVGKTAIETAGPGPCRGGHRQRVPLPGPHPRTPTTSSSSSASRARPATRWPPSSLAKSRGVPVLAVVNVVGSSIARAADYVLYTYAGPEIAVASTKAYMVQLCTLYLFALRLAYARGRLSVEKTRYHDGPAAAGTGGHQGPSGGLRADQSTSPAAIVNTQSCFFIGRGFDYALSLEGSLKLKEISYVHSDAYAAGELEARHHQPDHRRCAGDRAGHPEAGVRKDHLQRQGDPQPRCTGACCSPQRMPWCRRAWPMP